MSLLIENKESKKTKILHRFQEGIDDLISIAREVGSRPSYVAKVLLEAGKIGQYFDLYTHTDTKQNIYTPYFEKVLSFRSVESARKSIKRINEIYLEFEKREDRAGQHHAMLIALTGYNRARWMGKLAEAKVFARWLGRKVKI